MTTPATPATLRAAAAVCETRFPAEYQQAHTTLGCAKSTYPLGPTYCTSHHENWTPDGCPVAVRAAQEIGADALERASAWIYGLPWEAGQANRGPTDDSEEWMRGASDGVEWATERLTDRAERLRKGEGDE